MQFSLLTDLIAGFIMEKMKKSLKKMYFLFSLLLVGKKRTSCPEYLFVFFVIDCISLNTVPGRIDLGLAWIWTDITILTIL